MHHPGEDKICLMRTHQALVQYDDANDDTYTTVVETLAENISRTVPLEPENAGTHRPTAGRRPILAVEGPRSTTSGVRFQGGETWGQELALPPWEDRRS